LAWLVEVQYRPRDLNWREYLRLTGASTPSAITRLRWHRV